MPIEIGTNCFQSIIFNYFEQNTFFIVGRRNGQDYAQINGEDGQNDASAIQND